MARRALTSVPPRIRPCTRRGQLLLGCLLMDPTLRHSLLNPGTRCGVHALRPHSHPQQHTYYKPWTASLQVPWPLLR